MAVDRLINASYPVEYFSLEGIDRVTYFHRSWWASRQRFASQHPIHNNRYLATNKGGERTSEYLEIDLGRVRQINFLTMQVFKVPVNITIEYDVVSAHDGTHAWKGVKPMTEMEYDSKVRFRPEHKNPFEKCNFYFTDDHGEMVHTRYLRIRFTRVDARFPTKKHDPIKYSIMVKGLRSGRLIAGLKDTVGPIFNTGIDENTTVFGLGTNDDPNLTHVGASEVIRQNFVVPESARRGAVHADDEDQSIFPTILGFGILLYNQNPEPTDNMDEMQHMPHLHWEIRDVTDPMEEMLMHHGQIQETPNLGRTWVDVYFHEMPMEADPTRTYQLRVHSMNLNAIGSMYQQAPNSVPGRQIPGTLAWVSGSPSITTSADTTEYVQPGDFIMKPSGEGGVFEVDTVNSTTITLTANFTGTSESAGLGIVVMAMFRYDAASESYLPDYGHSLTMRLWGDVADSGRDILGNDYRYATYRDKAMNVFDGTRAGWVSAPMPDPNAVEALYFDVRTFEPGENKLTVIDALKISPLVQGTTMHVYYSDGWVNSRKPEKLAEWENLMWKPVPWTFELRSDQQFRLPTQIAASFIKLEFTNLKPRPFRIPRYPELPPVHYRRYPSWVEAQFENAQVRRVVNDWFVKHRTKVMRNVLKNIDDPLARFQYKLREFLASLALGKIGRKEKAVKEGLVDLKAGAFIDPVTAGKIYVNTKHLYKGTLKVTLDQDSLLGQMVANIHNPRIVGDPVEGEVNFSDSSTVPIVSSMNDRVTYSYAHLSQTPMWFNRPARHRYRKEVARFNKKAFFAGVAEVEFLRSDFTVARDDEVISETFQDELMIDTNTFDLETVGSIASGQDVYVSYELPNPGFVQDEVVNLSGGDAVALEGISVEPAINVRVFEGPGYTGQEYLLGEDFDLSFDVSPDGKVVNLIERNTVFKRTAVRRPPEGYSNIDVGMVVGQASVPVIRGYVDENVVTGHAIIYAAINYTDAATITAIGLPVTTHESKGRDHAGTITGIAVPSALENFQRTDSGLISGTGLVSATDLANHGDPASGTFLDAYYVSDTWEREAVSFWGTSTSGYTWVGPSNTGAQTDGNLGIMVTGGGQPTTDEAYLPGGEKRTNMKIRTTISWIHPAGMEHNTYLFLRAQSASPGADTYFLRIRHEEDGTTWGRIGHRVSGVYTTIGSEFQIAASQGPTKVVFEVSANNLKAKGWLVGTVEPTSWGWEQSSSVIQTPGYAGVRSEMDDMEASTTYFDNLYVTTDVSIPVGVATPVTTAEGKHYTDSGTATGVGVVSGLEAPFYSDGLAPVVGISVPSAVETFDPFVDLIQESNGSGYVAHPSTFSTGARTMPATTTAGNLVVIVLAAKGNSAAPTAATGPAGFSSSINSTTATMRVQVFYRQNCPATDTFTCTFGATKPNQLTMQVFEFSNMANATAHGAIADIETSLDTFDTGDVFSASEADQISVATLSSLGSDPDSGTVSVGWDNSEYEHLDTELTTAPNNIKLATFVWFKREGLNTSSGPPRFLEGDVGEDQLPHIASVTVFNVNI